MSAIPVPPAAAHSGEFRKILGLRDLVFAQVVNIVGLAWVGTAAKLGPSHVVFWLLAVTLFYVPSAAAVIYLNRLYPLEGGLYTWARLGFNDFVGFMAAWSLWLNCVVLNSEVGILSVTILGYALGPRAAGFAENKWLMAGASLLIIAALMLVTTLGFGIAKWVTNAAGFLILAVFLLLIVLPFRNLALGRLPQYHPLSLAMPTVSLLSLNILGKISFGALSGFDSVAVFAGECRDAARSIGRSVMIATPIIAVMFILGTSAVRAFVPDNQVDLVSPISQALQAGTIPSDPGAGLIPLVILGILASVLGQQNFIFAEASRLPLVTGWDYLLPKWFTRLHPKHKTPSNSILFIGAVTLGLGITASVGAGQQEAFQLLQSASLTFYALAYLVMFALPLVGFRNVRPRPPFWLKAACVSGFGMTALYAVLSVFPIIDVPNPRVFTIKVTGLIVVFNLMGAGIFWAYRRRQSR
ncbi:MAG: APC family permease [Acidobacteriia bacterium]|nr:APC family permease [Terriglobia bacterium]